MRGVPSGRDDSDRNGIFRFVYGRDREVEQLARSQRGVVVLAGDPGVGKSVVLAAAQVQAEGDGAVAPAPVAIRRSPAALQLALLDSLAAAVAQLARDEGLARTAARHVADAAKRMAKARLDELAPAVGKALLGMVRARLGSDVAEAIEEFARDLGTSVDERLAARISAAGDGDVIEMITGFAAETAALAGDRAVLLALDNAERLDEDDLRRLADLLDLLPDRVMIRLAYATADESAQKHLDALREAGATVIELGGLDSIMVARWLADEAVPAGTLTETMRVTAGYPLHVQDAVAALKAEGSLADLTLGEMTGVGTRRAWRMLDPGVQRAAIMLAAFTDPPPRERIPNFVGLDYGGWAVVEQRLREARIFAAEQDQDVWFHEMRRRYLWQEIMTGPQRHDAAEAAVTELLTLINNSGTADPALLVEFAGLLPLASGRLEIEPGTRLMAAAETAEIAIIAAMIELSEPGSSAPVNAEAVLLHAREAFGATGDLTAAMRSLVEGGLVAVQPIPEGAALSPSWAGDHSGLVVAGRAARELGRVPVPRVATAVFQRYLQPRLGPFTHVRYGVGRPRLADLSKSAFDLHRHREGGVLMLGRRAPSILLRADYEGVPLYATAVYSGTEDRDRARAEVGRLSSQVPGQPVTAQMIRAYPLPRVPCRRFLRAYQRLTGTAIGTPNGMLAATPSQDSAIPVSAWALTQAAVFAFAREATSPDERPAFDLDEPIGVIYAVQDGCVTAQIYNSPGARQVEVSAAENFRSPFSQVQLAHAAGLSRDQHLGRIIWTQGSGPHQDPVVATLLQISIQAAAFNQHQDRIAIDTGQAALQEALTQAAKREAADALALAAVLPAEEAVQKISGRTTYLVLHADVPLRNRPAGHDLGVTWGYIDHDHHADQEVRVAIQPADHKAKDGGRLAFLQKAFDLQPEELNAIAWTHSDATFAIAALLGFTISDIWLQHT